MTETPPESQRIAYQQYVAPTALDDKEVIKELGKHGLRETARGMGRVLVGEMTAAQYPYPVVFIDGVDDNGLPVQRAVEMGSMLDTSGKTEPDAYLLRFESDTEPMSREEPPLHPVDDENRRADLTPQQRDNGGMVLYQHGITGDVHIRAYTAEGQPIGYMIAVEIEPGQHQVEVSPGTAYLTAEPATQEDAP